MPATRPRWTPGRAYRPGRLTPLSGWPALPMRWPALLLGWLGYLLLHVGTPTLGAPGGQAVESLAGAAMIAATALLLAAFAGGLPSGHGAGNRLVRHGVALRHRSRRLRTPRLLDPDAAGRPRPRAPSVHSSVR
ncbi:DUF6412 domain-containing protein [Plantactinospora sonchi]|uniref:DUF6412 domain-containing protein n=1 Tax=Plantactinospora sonchi TaxID=1544735 RepID=A0ABU7RL37_9ACTN